VPPVFKGTN